ncbi:MAG: transglutaminase family protein [Synechococcales bacterium]|nr:transglutaminase family protein [Synechococcales bacterium]
MRYQIRHALSYQYDRPVGLDTHILRLRPRCDSTQSLHAFSLEVKPGAIAQSKTVELDGSSALHLRFDDSETPNFTVEALSEVKTHRVNPFDFLLKEWAAQLPIDYPTTLYTQLSPYLSRHCLTLTPATDPVVTELAQEILHATEGNTVGFLSELNQRIYNTCRHVIRETGAPLPPALTWGKQMGSCRDFTVLFMEACRAVGLAARFVSGYHEGDSSVTQQHLHAWAEVYLPGAGWRGYDPTLGLAVGDRHIGLTASFFPNQTSPVSGLLKPGFAASSTLSYRLSVNKL